MGRSPASSHAWDSFFPQTLVWEEHVWTRRVVKGCHWLGSVQQTLWHAHCVYHVYEFRNKRNKYDNDESSFTSFRKLRTGTSTPRNSFLSSPTHAHCAKSRQPNLRRGPD